MKLPLDLQNAPGLWLLAGLLPLVLLYVLKVQRRRHRVASTWLWSAARRDLLARSPFQKLVAQIPLLLQLLALVLLALALARPATRHHAILGDHVAIIVDASASMQAIDEASKKSRLELARKAAEDAITALSPGADAMILEAGRDPRLVAALDRDRTRLRAAVSQLAAHDVEGDLTGAVALAVDRLRQLGGSRKIIVFTDGNLAKAEPLRAAGTPLEVFTVGSEVDNAAIVRVDVRAGTDPTTKAEEVQAFAVVANFGKRPRDLFVTLRLSTIDTPLASRRILVAPGERAPVVLTFQPTPGDRYKGLVVDISPHDALAADDVAYGRVPPAAKQPAFLVSAGGSASPWLERALKSDPLVELSKGSPADLVKTVVEAGSLFVYDGICPEPAPNGDFVVMAPKGPACLGVELGAVLEKPPITSWNNGDPRFRFLTLDGVHIAKATSLRTQNATLDLVRAPKDTLAADISTPGRTGTLLGFDVGESDWPLKASFVLFMRNVVEVARAHRAAGALGPARAGEPLRVPVSSDVAEVTVDLPGEKEPRKLPAREGLAVVSDTRKAGLYRVTYQGARPGSTLLPVNLTSDAESDLRPRPLAIDKDGATVAPAAKLAAAHTDWTYLVALFALAFLVADVAYLTRRPRRRTASPPAPRLPERGTA